MMMLPGMGPRPPGASVNAQNPKTAKVCDEKLVVDHQKMLSSQILVHDAVYVVADKEGNVQVSNKDTADRVASLSGFSKVLVQDPFSPSSSMVFGFTPKKNTLFCLDLKEAKAQNLNLTLPVGEISGGCMLGPNKLAVMFNNGRICIVDTAKKELERNIDPLTKFNDYTAICHYEDQKVFIGNNGSILLLDLEGKGKVLLNERLHKLNINSLSLNAKKTKLLSAVEDDTINVYEAEELRLIWSKSVGGQALKAVWSEKEDYVVGLSGNLNIYCLSVAKGDILSKIPCASCLGTPAGVAVDWAKKRFYLGTLSGKSYQMHYET